MPKAEVTIENGDELSVRSFRVEEGVGRLFEIHVQVDGCGSFVTG